MMKTKTTYTGKLNSTVRLPVELKARFDSACNAAGLNQKEAFLISLTLLYSNPDEWTRKVIISQVDLPNPNFHVRLNGVASAWFDEIVNAIQENRNAQEPIIMVTKTEVIVAIVYRFIQLVEMDALIRFPF